MNSSAEDRVNLCFGGSTFLGVYQLGVAHCLYNNAKELLDRVDFYGGVSTGSIAAAILALCPDKITEYMEECRLLVDRVRQANGITPQSDPTITSQFKQILQKVLPNNGCLESEATGKLYIASNRFRMQSPCYNLPMSSPWLDPHEWIRLSPTMGSTAIDMFRNHLMETSEDYSLVTNSYESRDILIEVLNGSCYIPIWGGIKPPQHGGWYWMDAGLTNNLPSGVMFPGFNKTITVSPFLGDTIDIGPKLKNISNAVRVSSIITSNPVDWTAWNFMVINDALVPQPWHRQIEYFRTGYEDTLLFLRSGKIVRDEEEELCVLS
ncbi:patatin-like phospholipase domain-containing protein 4 [Ptychodera flava]|uniref:patatin-like phospholipase domain-containing protein 4 n=1 Tax=Ptychodera flava TaxID=63121 RepID=UPI003969DDD2